jgi:hypothetical protein
MQNSISRARARGRWPDSAAVPERKAEGLLFAEELWNSAGLQSLRDSAKGSAFVKGIAENTLDPRLYGVYHLQDAAYIAAAQVHRALCLAGRTVRNARNAHPKGLRNGLPSRLLEVRLQAGLRLCPCRRASKSLSTTPGTPRTYRITSPARPSAICATRVT